MYSSYILPTVSQCTSNGHADQVVFNLCYEIESMPRSFVVSLVLLEVIQEPGLLFRQPEKSLMFYLLLELTTDEAIYRIKSYPVLRPPGGFFSYINLLMSLTESELEIDRNRRNFE